MIASQKVRVIIYFYMAVITMHSLDILHKLKIQINIEQNISAIPGGFLQ